MLVKIGEQPDNLKTLTARVCWMDVEPLISGKTYLIQHGVNRQKAKIVAINSILEIESFEEHSNVDGLKLNQIGYVAFKLAGYVFVDSFEANPNNGAFIIIDEYSNSTVGVGFVV